MTRVCLLGSPDVVLKYELLSRETAREALSTYDLDEPYENAIALETVSVGAAVSLLNDLNWYLIRFVDAALVKDRSISEAEWLSRDLAEAVRNDRVDPDETGTYLKVYGVVHETEAAAEGADEAHRSESSAPTSGGQPGGTTDTAGAVHAGTRSLGRPVEPLYVRRTDGEHPEYDLRDVEETLVVRVTESEFSA